MCRDARKPAWGLTTRSDTNRAVQPQKMVRGLKFRIYEVEELYYLCSENKGTDQLRSYCRSRALGYIAHSDFGTNGYDWSRENRSLEHVAEKNTLILDSILQKSV